MQFDHIFQLNMCSIRISLALVLIAAIFLINYSEQQNAGEDAEESNQLNVEDILKKFALNYYKVNVTHLIVNMQMHECGSFRLP